MIDAINNWINGLTGAQQFLLFSGIKILGVFSVLMSCVAYAVWVERKVAAAIQDRVGPNRAGPFGLLQPACDGIKAFLKEDFTPDHVRKAYFWLAPAVAMIPALLTIAVIPFGSTLGKQQMVIANLNVGILYTFGIVSLGVYGIVLAGYAANSKYPFLGGIRSSAQLISYELAMGLSVIPIFLWVGDLNLSQVIGTQTGFVSWLPDFLGGVRLPNWLVFQSPMLALSFFIFLVSAFAETNRTPFDLPEAEQELAGGYNVEYSSIKFALFFMGEYANMILVSMLTVLFFLGGWDAPVTWLAFIPGWIWLGIKVFIVVTMFLWVRASFPR